MNGFFFHENKKKNPEKKNQVCSSDIFGYFFHNFFFFSLKNKPKYVHGTCADIYPALLGVSTSKTRGNAKQLGKKYREHVKKTPVA